jgi:hypothetical protein
MTGMKYLKGECTHCGGHIEFPADAVGLTTQCPHCGKTTELLLATPPEEPAISRKTIIWTVVAVIIIILGGIGLSAAFKIAQKQLAARQQPPPPPPQTNPSSAASNAPPPEPANPPDSGFRVSAITLEKTPGSSLVYAVGTVANPSAKRRFGVRVEVDLFDAADKKVGTAKDYQQVIEPNGEWHFRAMVIDSKAAASAKLASVKEDQ